MCPEVTAIAGQSVVRTVVRHTLGAVVQLLQEHPHELVFCLGHAVHTQDVLAQVLYELGRVAKQEKVNVSFDIAQYS